MAQRLSSRKPRQAPPTAAPPREAVAGDNRASILEAERVQLLSFVSRLDDADSAVEDAAGPYKAALTRRRSIVKLANAAGFTKKELDRRRDEMANSTGQNAQDVEREARHRHWLGILTPEQQKMHLEGNTPEEARDEADWETDGYKAGLRNRPAKPPPECPARFVQAWMRGHEKGFKSHLEAMAAAAPKPLGMTAQQIADDAEKLLAEDKAREEVDVDAEAAKLKASGFMARGPDDADEAFEATAEELAAQKPRQAVVEGREAEGETI